MSDNLTIEQLLAEYKKTLGLYKEQVVSTFAAENHFEYNEILLSAHSCAIEGNSFSVNDTRELKEHGISLKLQNKSMLEAFEILDHFKAFEYLFNNLQLPLSEQLLIDTHKLLTANTIQYTKNYQPGEYTRSRMAAGDTIFPDHEESIASVPALMEQTQEAINKKLAQPIEISAKFHKYFIYLHPFPDGNGRLGRLISNFILAKAGEPLVIIEASRKAEYIDVLKFSHKHNNLELISSFFIKTSINRMKNEIQQASQNAGQKINPSNNNKSKGKSFIF
ncbi:MAG: Fic family protein [Chitinophagaceae bacterium]|nr:Fic family protein [Chitinophagaceae bacterium]